MTTLTLVNTVIIGIILTTGLCFEISLYAYHDQFVYTDLLKRCVDASLSGHTEIEEKKALPPFLFDFFKLLLVMILILANGVINYRQLSSQLSK
mmetsp:Transcript_8940/g.15145  ORF Transcript_8940/g.15145 Transcript_8940/m.15145 type:complete len:94 (+) Transcript_8940:355-636(+)